ncbi:MAG TPA: hypothetical protein VMC80_02860 [Patescibacteria group bacterium]|nr:hypothetical protein [Patescibacteria group bacterium]
MLEETQKQVEKPWAVYGSAGFYAIGRAVKETKTYLSLQTSEGNKLPEYVNPQCAHRFANPVQAMAYYRVHHAVRFPKKQIIDTFLSDFPSQRANLENLLPSRFETNQSN